MWRCWKFAAHEVTALRGSTHGFHAARLLGFFSGGCLPVLLVAATVLAMTDARPDLGSGHPSAASASSALRHLRREVLAMQGYTPGEQVSDCVKLNTNECPYPPAPGVLTTLNDIGAERLRLYPNPVSQKLRDVAAATFGVSAEQVLAGNGSDDCLTVIFRAFLRAGERVAVPWPTYGLYDTLATLQDVEIVHVDYVRSANDWTLPSHLAQQAAKLLIVANPNNPSATLTPVAELRRLADQHDGIVVIDEAYIDFAPAGSSVLPFLDQHPNLIVLRTFSKSASLAGARLGLLFASAELIAHLMKVKDSYNVNVVSQALGVAALEDRDHHRELVRRVVDERGRLGRLLAERFGGSWPTSHGKFLLVKVGARAGEIYTALKAKGILVRWWNRDVLRDHLRITVGTPAQTDRLLAELSVIVDRS